MQRARAQRAFGSVSERTYIRSRNWPPDRYPSQQPTPASYLRRAGSKIAPTMILVSSSTSWRMRLAASSTSYSVRPSPALIEIRRPRAPFMRCRQTAGWRSPLRRHRRARRSPVASPVPIIAVPISLMIEHTSAKSRLTSPSLTIRSVMQEMPEQSTWSAIAKASTKVVFSLATRKRF